jgi:hypothetical protein
VRLGNSARGATREAREGAKVHVLGLGVDRGEAFDEFDALNLGQHRRTEDWQAAG